MPGDTNDDRAINANDLFFFSQFWQKPAAEAPSSCNPVDGDAWIDEKDLLWLMQQWK